ncbi:hypothetical protein PF006_g1622 [Phytophthora fragariae]|uniref:Uncharacterized protein n=1 Tax=Phytophthora fragariae TaxID=53985 RepID=A0A6A3UR27_9STRA|nr:hypothetical protein PF006_g1622 [Phytophthora fragariae]
MVSVVPCVKSPLVLSVSGFCFVKSLLVLSVSSFCCVKSLLVLLGSVVPRCGVGGPAAGAVCVGLQLRESLLVLLVSPFWRVKSLLVLSVSTFCCVKSLLVLSGWEVTCVELLWMPVERGVSA